MISRKTTLPIDSTVRKGIPLATGCYAYFPAALAGIARWSKLSNEKHNPGKPMHHARGKSGDHDDCIARHAQDIRDLIARVDRLFGTRDPIPTGLYDQIIDEADALAWRACAWSQELHERFDAAPLAPAAVLPEPEKRTLKLERGCGRHDYLLPDESCTCPRPIVQFDHELRKLSEGPHDGGSR